jgi:hypothetical protein
MLSELDDPTAGSRDPYRLGLLCYGSKGRQAAFFCLHESIAALEFLMAEERYLYDKMDIRPRKYPS